MALRENGLYHFKMQQDTVYVANWSAAWGAWVLKRYANGGVSPDPAYYITRHGLIMQPSGQPSIWTLANLVYLHPKPP